MGHGTEAQIGLRGDRGGLKESDEAGNERKKPKATKEKDRYEMWTHGVLGL
jgi:hypothetical protein